VRLNLPGVHTGAASDVLEVDELRIVRVGLTIEAKIASVAIAAPSLRLSYVKLLQEREQLIALLHIKID